jgi:crotonobetainyl-CoA:carnitine CoA-transferase CaiB-like acyl-CoA transferase
MDHQGGNLMAIAILAGLIHRNRTGEGQWIDISSTDVGGLLNGPALLDYTVNGRPLRRAGMPDSNRSQSPSMAPHGIYPSAGVDNWIAIACRDDRDWAVLAAFIGTPWAAEPDLASLAGRLDAEGGLDRMLADWTASRDRFEVAAALRDLGVPAQAVQRPSERIEDDPGTTSWGLWPTVTHSKMGEVRVDGLPLHLTETDWIIERGAPCLGEHNDLVFGALLGHTEHELRVLQEDGVV